MKKILSLSFALLAVASFLCGQWCASAAFSFLSYEVYPDEAQEAELVDGRCCYCGRLGDKGAGYCSRDCHAKAEGWE